MSHLRNFRRSEFIYLNPTGHITPEFPHGKYNIPNNNRYGRCDTWLHVAITPLRIFRKCDTRLTGYNGHRAPSLDLPIFKNEKLVKFTYLYIIGTKRIISRLGPAKARDGFFVTTAAALSKTRRNKVWV